MAGTSRALVRLARAVGAAAPLAAAAYVSPAVFRPPVAESFWSRSVATQAGQEKIANPLQGKHVKILQYEICPFCCKIKTVLDYMNVPYSTEDVNPLSKAQLKITQTLPEDHPAFRYKKVPTAVIGEDIVADSPLILEQLITLLLQDGRKAADTKFLESRHDPEVKKWMKWADKELAVLLFPNLTRNFQESYQAFGYVHSVPGFSMIDKISNQVVGATAMWLAQGKIKKKYGIENERQALMDCLDEWTAALENKPFLGGVEPNLADVCIFGVLRAVEGFDTGTALLEGSQVKPWYERMAAKVGERHHARSSRQ